MANNQLHRYLFKDLAVRGELVQLDTAYQDILANHNYPTPIKNLLGELLVATSLLTATLKFKGSITIQLQGDGPMSLAVINGNHQHKMRGVARWQGEIDDNASLHQLIGKGHLVITITPDHGERYQGVVGLEGETLSEVLEAYFERSEQLRTRLWLRTGKFENQEHAAGMLLQVMPDGTGSDEDFSYLEKLTETIKDEELFSLPAHDVLYRLYHQDKVEVFEPQGVEFFCGCSRDRSAGAIATLDAKEIESILTEFGAVILNCDYCGASYSFSPEQVAQIQKQAQSTTGNDNIH